MKMNKKRKRSADAQDLLQDHSRIKRFHENNYTTILRFLESKESILIPKKLLKKPKIIKLKLQRKIPLALNQAEIFMHFHTLGNS